MVTVRLSTDSTAENTGIHSGNAPLHLSQWPDDEAGYV
jgi:hypothetical protein